MMSAKKSKIPKFRNDEEERAFWSKHSIEEFGGDLEDLDVDIRPTRTEQIALRLSKEDLTALRALAKKRGVGHTTLARNVVEQWLERIRAKHVS
jgi:predicted DNA binding CopG/RHH family protein